jgi:hypothetical protein
MCAKGHQITIFGREHQNSMLGMASDGAVNPGAYSSKEMAIMHYVTPRKLLAAEQRAEHEKLDRLVNAGAAQDVVDHFRFFINKHYEILRRKQTETKYIAAQKPLHVNACTSPATNFIIHAHPHHIFCLQLRMCPMSYSRRTICWACITTTPFLIL